MRVKLVKIGNSIGVRLPKAVIQTCGLESEADLSVEDNKIILRALDSSRSNWQQRFEADIHAEPLRERGEWSW